MEFLELSSTLVCFHSVLWSHKKTLISSLTKNLWIHFPDGFMLAGNESSKLQGLESSWKSRPADENISQHAQLVTQEDDGLKLIWINTWKQIFHFPGRRWGFYPTSYLSRVHSLSLSTMPWLSTIKLRTISSGSYPTQPQTPTVSYWELPGLQPQPAAASELIGS